MRVGFTCHSGLQDLLNNIFHVPAMPGNTCWYLRTSCAEGRFAPRWTASFQGEVLQAIHNYSARKELCEDNVFCLSFSAGELVCFWNGHLASSCQLPPHLAFPNYKANLRWFCVLETEQDLGGLCNAVVAVQSRLPSTTALPVAGMRFHCLETLRAPDLSLSASHMVYVAAQGNASTGLRCEIQNVAAFVPDGDIVLGFTTQQAASTLEQLLRDLHRAPRGTVGVHLLVRRGRVVQHKLLSQNTLWEDCGQNVEPPIANHVTVQLLQVGPSLQYGRNGRVVETWSLRPLGPVLPRPAIMLRRERPLPDDRVAAEILRGVRCMEISDDGSARDILAERAWLCGGSSTAAMPQRRPWADEMDDSPTPSSSPSNAAAAAGAERDDPLMPSSSSAAAVATPQRCLWADERDELATPSSGSAAAAAIPERRPWAHERDDPPTLSSSRAEVRTSTGAAGHAVHEASVDFFRLLQSSGRANIRFLRACAAVLTVSQDVMSHAALSLMRKNYGWAHFFLSNALAEAPLPLYLTDLLISELKFQQLQLWYIHSDRIVLATDRGVAESQDLRIDVPAIAINEQGSQCLAVETCPWPKPVFAFAGPTLQAILFSVTSRVIQPASTLFLCMDTTRLNCLSVLRSFQASGKLAVDCTLSSPYPNWNAMMQLCLSVAPRVPRGVIVTDLSLRWWHVTAFELMPISVWEALDLMHRGSRCLHLCCCTLRWSCVKLRVQGQPSWTGSVSASWQSAKLQILVACASSGHETQSKNTEEVAGGATLPTVAEGCLPQVGERIMMLKSKWLKLILSGSKTMELRGRSAKTGWVWLGCKNLIQGRARVAACAELDLPTFAQYQDQHCVQGDDLPYARTFALWLEDVQQILQPVSFFKPLGVEGWGIVRFCRSDAPVNRRGGASRRSSQMPDASISCKVRKGRARGRGQSSLTLGSGKHPSLHTLKGKPSPSTSVPDWPVQGTGLPNIGNTCFLNAVLQALLCMPDIRQVLRSCHLSECPATCIWCLLRKTLAAQETGRADAAFMKQWLPVLEEHGMEAGAQESALLFADGICDTLRSQQAGLTVIC